ncbi:MAG TPA: DUF2723 domain-containing protein [Gemmatimonadaceae bacterium]|nr:DUF2723 domain-containing protein [Gemmatimonadaceae bacterium]
MLLAVYVATLAPDVTLWDAGELVAAAYGLGIPHPPGTPLFVLLGRAWIVLWSPLLGPAVALNLLSAMCTATACGVLGGLVGRWTRSGWMGVAAGIGGGALATVWRNATETEVYAVTLLAGALALWAGDLAGRTGQRRWLLLACYALALAVPLHPFALVVAPGVIVLAASDATGAFHWRRALPPLAAGVLAMGAGTLRLSLLAAGAALLLVELALPPAAGDASLPRGARRLPRPAAVVGLVALAATALLVMLVRARADPALNQGNPATLAALADVIARRQYDVAPLWQREAPLWLQLGNVLQWADWQVALGLAPGVIPSWARTPVSVLWALLAVVGARAHRGLDRRSWRALLVLLAGASVGVVLYLNLKAGPSYGWGVLPGDAPHEARERDYFFVFAFWIWGAWAAMGFVALGRRWLGRPWAGALLATVPLALNWSAVDRRRAPDTTLARDVAAALLASAPPRAVLLTAADNDSYPTWYLQQVEGVRTDVTVVAVPLLPAPWYRAELARRWRLGGGAGAWLGPDATLGALAADAAEQGRPLVASAALPAARRAALGATWTPRGVVWRQGAATAADGELSAAVAARVARQVAAVRPAGATTDGGPRSMRRLLGCANRAASPARGRDVSLDSACNVR